MDETEPEDQADSATASEFLSLVADSSGDDLEHFRALEALYPRIRESTPATYRQFKKDVVKTMEEDDVISVMEFALQKSITRFLDPAFGLQPDRPIRHRGFDTMLEPVSDLLSILAKMEETEDTQQAAFDLGVKNLNHMEKSDFTFREMDSGNLAAFDQVLEDIAHAVPMCRANVVYACEALILMNDDATMDQVLMMCAIADTMGRPRPDWTEQ